MKRFLAWTSASALVIAQLVAFTGVAHASGSAYRSGDTLTVLAVNGKTNDITIDRLRTGYVFIVDLGDSINAGNRCTQVGNGVECEDGGLARIVVNTRDLNDKITNKVLARGEFQSGSGNDRIDAGPGNDRLDGQAGDDALIGRGGADQHNGGDGNDTLLARDGVQGNDTLDGGLGGDRCDADTYDTKVNCER